MAKKASSAYEGYVRMLFVRRIVATNMSGEKKYQKKSRVTERISFSGSFFVPRAVYGKLTIYRTASCFYLSDKVLPW